MIALKLAYRNLIGAGLRTWLNVIVLSFSFVVIIFQKGFLEGWNRQARRDTIAWEIGGGVYWHEAYDPYDYFTINDSHERIPDPFHQMIENGSITPVLLAQASFYPEGRIQSVLLKGIDPDQKIVSIPSSKLKVEIEEIPAIIGTKMASNNQLKEGDFVTVRWRDTNGTFDAAEVKIVGLFKTDVPTVDAGQLWIPLERLRSMMGMEGEATILITDPKQPVKMDVPGWIFRDHDFLLSELDQIIRMKSVGGSVFYILLLSLAMLAIFDTQILSIFRRQKEIGTNIALGMTRGQVIRIFTFEGALHGVLAAVLAAVWGIPLLALSSLKGFPMPGGSDDYGIALAERIFPAYSAGLVVSTILIVLVTVTIVSFLPTRKISKMKPTDAIRGKIQ
jgi:putative ABC transport system permease protein